MSSKEKSINCESASAQWLSESKRNPFFVANRKSKKEEKGSKSKSKNKDKDKGKDKDKDKKKTKANKKKVDDNLSSTNRDRHSERRRLKDKDLDSSIEDEEILRIEEKKAKCGIDIEDVQLNMNNNNILGASGDIEQTPEFLEQLHFDLLMKHPNKVTEGKLGKMSVCTRTGCFCCCQCCRKSNVEQLGLGMIIYFKLMKALILGFFIVVFLHLPIIFVYFMNNPEKIANDYNELLYKTTIGNIGSTLYNCESFYLDELDKLTDKTFEFNCRSKNISSLLGFGTVDTTTIEAHNNQKCFPFLPNNQVLFNSSCDLKEALNNTMNESKCFNNTNCTVTFDMASQRSNCVNKTVNAKVYLVYNCYDSHIRLGYKDFSLPRNYAGVGIAGIDILSVFVIILTLCSIEKNQEKDYQDFIETRVFIRDFTLYLSNLTVKESNLSEEIGDLIKHFKDVMSEEDSKRYLCFSPNKTFDDYYEFITQVYPKNNFCLFDIIYPKLTCEKLDGIKKYRKLQKELHKMEIEKAAKEKPKEEKQDLKEDLKEIKETKEDYKPKEKDEEKDIDPETNKVIIYNILQAQVKDPKIEKMEEKLKDLNEYINRESSVKEVKEFYLTFRTFRIAKYIEDKYRMSKCTRCCLICMCKKKLISRFYYKGKWLDLSFSKDEPTNLKWENMTYSPCKRCCRKAVSIVIAVIVMLATLLAIIGSQLIENLTKDKFNTSIDCDFFVNVTEHEIVEEFKNTNKKQNEKYLTYCFCSNAFSITDVFSNALKTKTLHDDDGDDGSIKPCENFVDSFVQYQAINIGIILIIPLVNTLVNIIFKGLTTFERNKTLSKDMNSNMSKIFIVSFINSGLLLVITNLRVDFIASFIPWFPFFQGDYLDFDPAWYNKVGNVILFSMLLDIFMPHATAILGVILNHICRCCDGGCSGGKKTKALTKEDYFEIYTGPEFEIDGRYASLLSSFFVTLMFSAGLPFLHLFFFLNLIITYIVDKILILKFYRNPPKYDLGIIHTFIFYCFVALFIHFAFAVWLLSNPYLLIDEQEGLLHFIKVFIDDYLGVKKDSFLGQILERLTLTHSLLLIMGFVLFALIILFRTLFSFFKLVCGKKELDLEKDSSVEIGLACPMRDLYKTYIIKELEYSLLKKMEATEKIQAQIDNLLEGIQYLRAFMIYKLERYTNRKFPELRMNFDAEIKKKKSLFTIESKGLMVGDSSYDIAFIPEFESAAYYDYLKKL